MTTPLSYHIQRPGAPPGLRDQVQRANPRYVKIMDPDHYDGPPFGQRLYIGRLYWPGEPDKAMVWNGPVGARQWWQMAWPRIQRAPWCQIWEGPNEVHVTTPGQMYTFADFELERVALLHGQGFASASGVFSTGCPYLSLWPIWRNVLKATDFLALHEYGMKHESPQMGRTPVNMWHLYRHEKVFQVLRDAGIRIPPTLITETGIDYGGGKTTDGWRAQGLTEEQFMGQLATYAESLPPEVLLATPFTWETPDWVSFDMGGRMSEIYTDYVASRNTGDDDLARAVVDAAHNEVLPLNPDAALYKAAKLRDAALMPASDEFYVPYSGDIIAQSFRRADDDRMIYTAWTREGEWSPEQVRWIEHAN